MTRTNSAKKSSASRAILLTGLVAGLLDGSAASISYFMRTGKSPERVFRFISSGIFGKDAYNEGWIMPALGVLLHFFIAFSFTIFFFLLFPRLKWLSKYIVLTGLVYGLLAWVVMNKIVLPLSNTAKLTPTLAQTLLGISFIMFCIGLPIALLTKRYYTRKTLQAELIKN